MQILGPAIEPLLSRHQAAIRGGSCFPNIKIAIDFLRGRGEPILPRDPTLLDLVLGKAKRACCAMAESARHQREMGLPLL